VPATLESTLAAIRPLDRSLEAKAQAKLDNLTKPRGSLGRLEELALKLCLIQGTLGPSADPARAYTVAGDHGVAAEGVSLYPSEVTRQMVLNFVAGGAAINVLARAAGAELYVVDAGCAGGGFPPHERLVQGKVAAGTANLAQGPAMSAAQCRAAVELGISLADRAAADGVRTLLTGDMGIANTTPSTALYCALFGLDPAEMTGPGTGLDSAGVGRKAAVVRGALALHAGVVAGRDPLAVLAALGGLEIACLAGLVLGGAQNRQAVLVDGFISTAAYAVAARLCPPVADFCFLSHASAEPGYARAVRELGQRPLLDLGLRLGEGTGAALALFLLRCGAKILGEMASFEAAGVSKAVSA
jgi:nicotinate-nucleotide--dimethylbenzimidazole phosphoribosyltransferase